MEKQVRRWSADEWWASDERDACGTGFVAHRHGVRSHGILQKGLRALENLEHRGAVSTDGKSSDGAGILAEIPYEIIARDLDLQLEVSDEGRAAGLAVAMVFLPRAPGASARCEAIFEEEIAREGFELRGWRDVPFDASALGDQARRTAPCVRQAVVADSLHGDIGGGRVDGEHSPCRRRLYLTRRRIERRALEAGFDDFALPSFSDRTIVYKGLVLPTHLSQLYPDLADPCFQTSVALFHQRYSTNTLPTWRLAQPLRFLAHNGEINTLLGNVNRMRAREPEADASVWGETVYDLVPVIGPGSSDSLALDNTLELLVRSGRSLTHAMAMLVPEAHEARPEMDPKLRAFFRYHEAVMEPWDGPAALVFTDGETAGASLDRNGLRPLRYWVAADGLVVVGSEAGIVDIDEADIVEKGRLGPGEMIAVDLRTGEFRRDAEIKADLARRKPWKAWIDAHGERAGTATRAFAPMADEALVRHQKFFGYGTEHFDRVLEPMCRSAREPIGSMGDDTPLAVLSEMPQRLYRYFKQRFAQVTNPPIDPLRERLVMSLTTKMGLAGSLLREDEEPARFIEFPSPIITSEQLAWLEGLDRPRVRNARLTTVFDAAAGPGALKDALDALCEEAEAHVRAGVRVLILSDRVADEERAPIPTLLATAAVHHHLIRAGLRMRAALVCDGGDIIEDHDFACLLGYGAMLIHPYVAYDSVTQLAQRDETLDVDQALANYRSTVEKGLLKIMAKMGISAVSSYRSAQIFEILGLSKEVVDVYFTGTPSRIGGANLELLAGNTLAFHAEACGSDAPLHELGLYRFRRNGEYHAFNPLVFTNLHKAVRNQDFETFKKYASQVDDRPPMTIRDLLTWRKADAIALDEVEPAEDIVQRFSTQAMSFGSLSRETHEVLAVAMNRIGGKSNSGEGGEERDRFEVYDRDRPDRSVAEWHPKRGDWGNSHIKQVASGRFGVTPYYLASARELEIKMAQGSKPGEGGHIPGFKVTTDIAATRRSQPGVTLISPPPHHDIYSIEDLAQLIYDLKRVNGEATVCVKLVSVVGVGTIAAGVAKGYADTIQISGHDGGTGASPLGSIKHAGLPWELGLSEIQQTLVRNGLRSRIKLRVDGGLKTGRDVIIAALLGGEEFGFGTAALVAAGCVMARKCHSNTCPVGVATQRDDLRARFPGTPEHVVSFMFFVAEHVRLIMAEMGVRRLDDLIGRTDLLERKEHLSTRGESVDTTAILALSEAAAAGSVPLRRQQARNDRPEEAPPLDQIIADDVLRALEELDEGERFTASYAVDNRERSIGARLSGLIARRHHEEGLPEGTVEIRLEGQAGQSFGVFGHHGLRFILDGEAQDYVGKGLGGAELVIRPPKASPLAPHDQVILGNTALYGATAGRLFAAGRAGERLAVRNSGARAVVEGCGDHGCEYMTGGAVVVLGPTGLNFGAGMSGGVAYVWDPDDALPGRHNPGMVDLQRVSPEDDGELRAMVEAHRDQTCSPRARDLLARWEQTRGEFWKVVPKLEE